MFAKHWIPAFAGMTNEGLIRASLGKSSKHGKSKNNLFLYRVRRANTQVAGAVPALHGVEHTD
jgi:hypothetical protein